jgi:penicillin-binding protein 1A
MSRPARQRRQSRRRGHPVTRILLIGAMLAVCGLVLGAAGVFGWVLSVADSSPNIGQLKPRVPGQVSQVFAANGQSLGYIASDVVRTNVAQSRQPAMMRKATVAIEDRRFWHHGGVDYYGILRAGVRDVLDGGDALQGGSTLTMQLVDNVYLPDNFREQRSLRYKIVQAKLANQLEDKESKSWILTQYLNDVPYGTVGGQTAIGIGAAAQMFFDKPVQKLDLAQYALLAGLPQAPSDYNPFLDPKLARQRRSQVLTAMLAAGYITASQEQAANASRLQVHHSTLYQNDSLKQPYVYDYVEQQLVAKLGQATVDAGGLKVYTTINLQDQAYAKTALEENEGYADDPKAALVTIDPSNGNIEAMAQNTTYGLGAGQTTFDYATQSKRQTGSAFKTFVLMTLIHDQDGDPNTTYYDSKYLAAGWLPGYPSFSVHTSEETYQGVINITKATTVSDNTVFAQLGVDLGMSNVSNTAYAMGITSHQCDNPAEAIGGLCNGVSPLQMADAYATLADGGVHHTPTILAKVVLPDGKTENFGNPTGKKVFTDGETYAATQVLKTVVTSGTGTASSYGCPVAGKTGTTSNYTDAWFVGYSPNLSTAVWVGYPDENEYMNDVNDLGPGFGGTLASPIWRDFMEKAENGYCQDFPTPTTYWHGTPYFGTHATSAQATQYTTTGTTTTGTTTTSTSTSTTGATSNSTAPGAGNTANPGDTGNAGGGTGGTGGGTGAAGGGTGGAGGNLPPAAAPGSASGGNGVK